MTKNGHKALKEILEVNNFTRTSVGPFNIKQPLPYGRIDYFDPFILLHHSGPEEFKPGQASSRLMPHPHAGFEPVTFLYDGEIYHRDSLGNEGYLNKGDVQWMTSGNGIIHSEGPTENFTKYGGTMELIQLWVNVPAKYKKVKPRYQQVSKSQMPHFNSASGNCEMRVVSGTYNGLKGPVETFSPVLSVMGVFSAKDELELFAEEEENSLFYLLSGEAKVNGMQIRSNQCVFFKNKGNKIQLETLNEHGKFLFLSARKLNEEIAAYGPFVMSNRDELMEVMKDYQSGKMGSLDA